MSGDLLHSILLVISLVVIALPMHAAEKIRVILDTDANYELDDQHAIAYPLFNGHVFDPLPSANAKQPVNRLQHGHLKISNLADPRSADRQLCGGEGSNGERSRSGL